MGNSLIIKTETWKPVIGLESYCKISSLGRVFSLSRIVKRGNNKMKLMERMLTPSLGKNGYYYVSLTVDKIRYRFLLHRLLAIHFIPNPDSKKEVNHIDFNPKNYSLDNLEWVTPSENMKHVAINGRSNIYEISKIAWEKSAKRVDKISINGEYIETYESISEAARRNNTRSEYICAVLKGRQKTCIGFKWIYSNN